MTYLASEQAAIEVICPDAENIHSLDGGEPFLVLLDEVAERKRLETAENNPRRRHPVALETGVQPTVRKEA